MPMENNSLKTNNKNEIADIDKRDAVYRTLLNMLKLERNSRLAL